MKRSSEAENEPSSKHAKSSPLEASRSSASTRDRDDDEVEQPSKKAKEETHKHQRVNRVETVHHDVDDFEDLLLYDSPLVFHDDGEFEETSMDENAAHDLQERFLIFRCGDHDPEPELNSDELRNLDKLADQVEVSRLVAMNVLKKTEALSETELGQLAENDHKLTAKFIRTWRSKVDEHGKYWLRRARLVAREYQFLEERSDVHSPSTLTLVTHF